MDRDAREDGNILSDKHAENSSHCIGKNFFRAGSVYMLPVLVTLSPKIPSCIRRNSHKSALQQKIFVITQTSTISVTNTGHVH